MRDGEHMRDEQIWVRETPEAEDRETSVHDATLAAVRAALSHVDARIVAASVRLDTSLVDDLGLDSLRFVRFVVAIENALDIDEFPLQDWYDAQVALEGEPHFTVHSVVAVCIRCAAKQRMV